MKSVAKFLIAWIVLTFVWSRVSTFINVDLLMNDWMAVDIFRTWDEEQSRIIFLNLAFAIYAFAAIWVCARYLAPRGGSWILRGLELGVFLTLLTHVPINLSNYTTFPIPDMVAIKEVLCFSAFTMLAGFAVALVYRKEIQAGAPSAAGAKS